MSTKTKLTLSFLLPNQSFSKRERKRSVQEYGDDAKNGYLQFVKKILEKFIFDKMFQIFIENKQIATNQFGFKPGDSCIKACFCYFLSIFCFSTKCQPFQNYEKCFLFQQKSSFRSGDIHTFVIFSLPFQIFQIKKPTNGSGIICDVMNWLA